MTEKGSSEAKSKKAQSKAQELEATLAAIAAPMIVTDEDLVVTRINDAALKAMGYSRDEVVGKMTCAELSKTAICGTADYTIKNCLRTGSSRKSRKRQEGQPGAMAGLKRQAHKELQHENQPVAHVAAKAGVKKGEAGNPEEVIPLDDKELEGF